MFFSELRRTRKIVPFALELIVEENEPKVIKKCDEAREKIRGAYPILKLNKNVVFGGYGGKLRGPCLEGQTDAEFFKRIFGGGINSGLSCVSRKWWPPFPYFKWYQTGELKVPYSIQHLVKGVYISRSQFQGFEEHELLMPIGAREY